MYETPQTPITVKKAEERTYPPITAATPRLGHRGVQEKLLIFP
jgi:hypothetical protein